MGLSKKVISLKIEVLVNHLQFHKESSLYY